MSETTQGCTNRRCGNSLCCWQRDGSGYPSDEGCVSERTVGTHGIVFPPLPGARAVTWEELADLAEASATLGGLIFAEGPTGVLCLSHVSFLASSIAVSCDVRMHVRVYEGVYTTHTGGGVSCARSLQIEPKGRSPVVTTRTHGSPERNLTWAVTYSGSIMAGATFTTGLRIIATCLRSGDTSWPGDRGCGNPRG